MAHFEKDEIIFADNGEPIKIIKPLGIGGQGEVYEVEYKGKKKAFKYFTNVSKWHEGIYDILKDNINLDKISKSFTLPEAITKKPINFEDSDENKFGYIMSLIPDSFVLLSDYIASNTIVSLRCIVDISMKILLAFRTLHYSGYCYHNLNDAVIFIDINTRDVVILGAENITPNGYNLGVINSPRYATPENNVNWNKQQDIYTSRHSLYVILFMFLFKAHPFEGQRWLNSMYDNNIYGENAVFIADPDDDSNRPDAEIQKHFIYMWEMIPDYVRKEFLGAFCKATLQNKRRRPFEVEFLRAFARFRSSILTCECGNEILYKNDSDLICDSCGKRLELKYRIIFDRYSIIAQPGVRIYKCQFYSGLRTSPAGQEINPAMLVVANKFDKNMIGLQNMSSVDFVGEPPSGKIKLIHPGTVVPLKKGISIKAFGSTIKIDEM